MGLATLTSFNPDRFSAVTDALGSGTFDAAGMNSTTFQPKIPSQNSATNPSFGFDNSSVLAAGNTLAGGSDTIASAAASAGITGGSTPPASTTGSSDASGSSANNWFVRAVIVVLGFIFVGVGLAQFGSHR